MHTELVWFRDIHSVPYTSPFQCVLAGHLRLCRALFTCEGVDKKKYGQDLCVQLISKFLFPASRMIQESQEPLQGIVNINPVWVNYSATCHRDSLSSLIIAVCGTIIVKLSWLAMCKFTHTHAQGIKLSHRLLSTQNHHISKYMFLV